MNKVWGDRCRPAFQARGRYGTIPLVPRAEARSRNVLYHMVPVCPEHSVSSARRLHIAPFCNVFRFFFESRSDYYRISKRLSRRKRPTARRNERASARWDLPAGPNKGGCCGALKKIDRFLEKLRKPSALLRKEIGIAGCSISLRMEINLFLKHSPPTFLPGLSLSAGKSQVGAPIAFFVFGLLG